MVTSSNCGNYNLPLSMNGVSFPQGRCGDQHQCLKWWNSTRHVRSSRACNTACFKLIGPVTSHSHCAHSGRRSRTCNSIHRFHQTPIVTHLPLPPLLSIFLSLRLGGGGNMHEVWKRQVLLQTPDRLLNHSDWMGEAEAWRNVLPT
jgi:hypothetical protein